MARIAGTGIVLTFLPQILILFFFIGLLEDTGYMARAAFIMDRMMSRVGLNGKSFIPLLSSYACAIPGIMATRTIENPKDRLVTILVAPLMSCSARLPVYLLMIAALMPGDSRADRRQGRADARHVCARDLRRVWFRVAVQAHAAQRRTAGHESWSCRPYRLPRVRDVAFHMLERAWIFVRRAGTVILGISVVLWFLASYPKAPNGATRADQLAQSFAGRAGHAIEPVIKPLGFDWRIGISLISSFAAREVFVSSTAVVFNVEGVEDARNDDTTHLRDVLRSAHWPDGRTLFTPLVCLTLMVFYVFAMQCASTLAVVRRETNSWKWPAFQTLYMTGTAWILCFILYQSGRALGF